MTELAGVTVPYPKPITSAPNRISQAFALAITASPAPHSTRLTWLTRSAPCRAIGAPDRSAPKMAVANTAAVMKPTKLAGTPTSACATGASTGGT
jgi:hypothetical protein